MRKSLLVLSLPFCGALFAEASTVAPPLVIHDVTVIDCTGATPIVIDTEAMEPVFAGLSPNFSRPKGRPRRRSRVLGPLGMPFSQKKCDFSASVGVSMERSLESRSFFAGKGSPFRSLS